MDRDDVTLKPLRDFIIIMAVLKLYLVGVSHKAAFVLRHLSCVIEKNVSKVSTVEVLDHLLELRVHLMKELTIRVSPRLRLRGPFTAQPIRVLEA